MKTKLNHLYKLLGAALVVLLILPSCKKQEIVTPTFDVSVTKTTYAVNEPIIFSFTGTGDVVQFYSGAPGAEYIYKDRVTVDGKPQLQFSSFRETASAQANTLSVLISKDFVNLLNTEDIQKATWVDLTSRVKLSTGADNTASGVIDLSDQLTPNIPVFIAFRYKADKDAAVAQPKWTIKNLTINNVLADGTVIPIATQANMNWGTFSVLGTQAWTTALVMTGGGINADPNDDWVISRQVQLDRAQRVFGTSLKVSATTKLETYTFTGYTAPGTYVATFEVLNANKWDTKKVVKEITFTVK